MEETKPKKKWQTIIGLGIGIGVVMGIQFSRTNVPYSKLVNTSKEINEKGAVAIDNDTRLDSTSVIKDPLTLVYYYTAVTVDKNVQDIDVNNAKKVLSKQTQDNLDTNPEMNDFRENHISLKYTYRDKKGKFLFDFTIKPKNIQ